MNKLTNEEKSNLIEILKDRFLNNMNRHKDIKWESVLNKLTDDKLHIINNMEQTGGEPDLVIYNNEYYFFDCSKETPKERVSLCYDKEALDKRKNFKPVNTATNMASDIGIELLDEAEYKHLQGLGDFDLKTSSWLKTPSEIRKLGGAIFGDKRYNQVFIYHNGADSYYGSRGFRGKIKIN